MKNSLLGLAAGVLFLLVGLAMLAGSYRATTHYLKTTGRIVDVKAEEEAGSRKMYYAPIVEFKTTDEKVHQFTSSISSTSEPAIGDTVPILYNPNVPEEAIVEDLFDMYGLPGILTAFGVFFTLIFTFGPKRGILHQKE